MLGGVINTSNTIPVLDHFLFDLDGSKLKITSSDLETTMISSIEVDSSSKGSVAIPSKLLIDTLKTFPEQPLTFTVEDNNTVEISSNHGKYALAYTEGDQFPKTISLENPSNTKISRPGQIRQTSTMFHRVRWIENFQIKKTVIVWRAIYLDKLEVFNRALEILALTLRQGQEVEEIGRHQEHCTVIK